MKNAVVTGGFGILGRAVSRCLKQQGWQVAAIDIAAAPLAHDHCADLRLGGCDLTREADVRAAFAQVAAALGHVDALAHVAGGFVWQAVEGGRSGRI